MNEVNGLCQSPLHLCCDWTLGLNLLLASGYDPNLKDSFGWKPLDYALAYGGREAARSLLEFGSNQDASLEYLLNDLYEEGRLWPMESHLQLMLETITQRRERLSNLASAYLSCTQLQELSSLGNAKDDTRAHAAWKALKLVGAKLPPSLDPTNISIYKAVRSKELWLHLYSLGFQDVNAFDIEGYTPLMRWAHDYKASRETGTLLLQHGADPLKKHLEKKLNVVEMASRAEMSNFVSIIDIDVWRHWRREYPEADRDGFDLIENLDPCMLQQQHTVLFINHKGRLLLNAISPAWVDSCRCFCSPSGCSPTKLILRSFLKVRPCGRSDAYSSKEVFRVSLFIWSLYQTVKPLEGGRERLRKELIRLITFEHLEITHTCCQRGAYLDEPISQIPQDDIDDIHEEECDLIGILEEMIQSREAKGWKPLSLLEMLLEMDLERPPTIRLFNLRWIAFWLGLDEVACENIRIQSEISEVCFWNSFWFTRQDWEQIHPERSVLKEPNRISSVTNIKAIYHEEVSPGAESDSDIDSEDLDDMDVHALCVEFRVFLDRGMVGKQGRGFALSLGLEQSLEAD